MSSQRRPRLVLTLPHTAPTPREYRQNFAQAVRESIMRAALTGRLDIAHAEECWRVVPDPERA